MRKWTVVWMTLVAASIGVADIEAGESGEELLAAALAHHDPDGLWDGGRFRLILESSRPDGSVRTTTLDFDNTTGIFRTTTDRDEGRLEATIDGESCGYLLDGSAEISEERRESLGLDCARSRRLRDYYHYMWGLPMKLRDGGTRLGAVDRGASFQGVPVHSLRVTYDEEIGTDSWYFYLDPETSGLVGYRFYHDEAKGDGEYIVLEGELEAAGVRFPRSHTWYTNADDELLGTDTLVAVELVER